MTIIDEHLKRRVKHLSNSTGAKYEQKNKQYLIHSNNIQIQLMIVLNK